MNTTKQSVKTQKTTQAIKGVSQAQLDAINDMGSSSGAIGADTVISLGADMVRDRRSYPKQVQKTLRYVPIALRAGNPLTPAVLNSVAIDYMKKTPLAQRDPKLAWADGKGEPYAQDVVEIFKHYGSMMLGQQDWKSKKLDKSECYVIG